MSERNWITRRDAYTTIDGSRHALVWDSKTGRDVAWIYSEGEEDNGNSIAFLIAAAPRLLAALKLCVLAIPEGFTLPKGSDQNDPESEPEPWFEATAAIAAAEGTDAT